MVSIMNTKFDPNHFIISSNDTQPSLFYTNIKYDNKKDIYIFHYAGAGYYEGKRFGDDLYYTGQNYHYTISEKTIEKIIVTTTPFKGA